MTSAPHRSITRRPVLVFDGGTVTGREEAIAGEEPLQIRACGSVQEPVDLAVTMRTPGDEDELEAGFLVTEGLVTASELKDARFDVADVVATSQPENEITVRLTGAFDAGRVASRAFIATASCGICGKASIEDVERRCPPLSEGPRITADLIRTLPDRMRS